MSISSAEIAAKLEKLCVGLSPEQEKVLRLVAQGMKFILKMMEDEAKYPDRGYIMEIFRAIKGGKLDSELAGASSIEELQKLLMINVQMNQQPYE